MHSWAKGHTTEPAKGSAADTEQQTAAHGVSVAYLLGRSITISTWLWICTWHGCEYGGDRQYFDGWHIYPVGKLYVEESSELYGGDQTSMDLEQ